MTTTTKKPKLKLLDETSLIHDLKNGITKQTKTYQLGDQKFQIRYENSNGSPLGFNHKMCICQYSKSEAKWNYLEDISVIKDKLGPTPSYFSYQSKQHMIRFFKEMEDRLVRIYS